MIEKLAGLPGQIRALERRLKEMDATKVKPSVLKEITDTINNLKSLLKEKLEKKEERKKLKEQKAAEAPKEEVQVESAVETEAESRCAICGQKFQFYSQYIDHQVHQHNKKEYAPMDPAKKKEVVKNVEKNLGPAIISEKEESIKKEEAAPAPKFKLDDIVKPIRGEESTGKVMRWDGKPSDLVYVAWDSGPLADRDGFGGYYPSDLELFVEEKVEEPKQEVAASVDHMADLKSNYMDLLKDLKEEREAHYAQGNHPWVARLDQKIKDLEAKIAEKFGNDREASSEPMFRCTNCHAPMLPTTPSHLEHDDDGQDIWHCNEKKGGAQNAEELTIMDHTPPRANSGPDAGGKDTHDEFQDEWAMPAGVELVSAKGAPGSLFNAETADHVAEQLNSFINAPYKHAQVSKMGGPEHVSILLTVSADPKEQWANGILHNSRYGMFHISNDGEVEHYSGSFNRINEPKINFRKRNVKNVEQLVAVINEHLAKVNSTQAATPAPKQADLNKNAAKCNQCKKTLSEPIKDLCPDKKFCNETCHSKFHDDPELLKREKQAALEDVVTEPTKLSVFNRSFDVILPFTGEKKFAGYDISVGGKKLLNIKPQNGQPMTKAQLEWAVKRELTSGYKQAKLTSRIAMLSEGSKVYIVASDKTKKMVKIASFEHNVRAWVPESKIKLIALESQAVSHNGHSDKVLGQTGSETLIDCTEAGPIWVSSTELMDENRPPATPEALNDLESAIHCPHCQARIHDRQAPTCENCDKPLDKEALKTAIPPSISDQDAYLDNPPVDKAASGECRPGDLIIGGKTGLMCVNCGAEKGSDGVVHHDPKKNPQLGKKAAGCDSCAASMINGVFCHETGCPNAPRKCRHGKRSDVCSVCSDPFEGEGAEVESSFKKVRPFSKKAEVMSDPYQSLTTHVENMRSRMNQVQDRLQSNPLPKQADADMVNGDMTPAQILEDIEMGLALLENKIMDNDVDSEINPAIEEMEILLASVESELGMGEKSIEVKKEAAGNEWPLCSVDGCKNKADSVSEGKRYCYTHSWGKQNLKEAALPVAIAPTLSNPAPTTNNSATPIVPDDKKISCPLCGGMTFNDQAAYQQHMEFTHASDTMPTSPSQKLQPTNVKSEKVADVVTDETITTNDTTVPAIPTIKNVQPTDDHNLEDPTQMPTSPLPAGQKWQWNGMIGKYVAMTDASNINKAI